MVGFPGETEEQFMEIVDFVKKSPLDNVGIFKFSLEKEAYAARLPNQNRRRGETESVSKGWPRRRKKRSENGVKR